MLIDDVERKNEIKEEIELDWDEIEAIAIAREQGQFWEQKGVEDTTMSKIVEGREDPMPTNKDLIKELYNYETEDDLTIPDEEHYRWCKPPGSAPELFRRNKNRVRRFEYFQPPSIKRGNSVRIPTKWGARILGSE